MPVTVAKVTRIDLSRVDLDGRYILVRQFFGGTLEVRDLATGASMLGPLVHATWIDQL